MIDVLVIGDANPDLVLRGDVVPRFGQAEQLLDAAELVLGGSASITAHGLARLGRSTRLCSVVGRDTFGDLVLEILDAQGVDTFAVLRESDVATGLTVVLSRASQRAILTYLGSIGSLSADHVSRSVAEAAAAGASHLHVCSFFLLGPVAAALPAIFAQAQGLGLTTSLDTNDDPRRLWDGLEPLLDHLDYLLPNGEEALAIASRLAGRPFTDIAEAGVAIARRGPVVVVKDGPRGALLANPDGTTLSEPGRPVEPVDTTGAGDTFNAAFLDSTLRGLHVQECLRRACLAGALSTSFAGGVAGQPTVEQLDGSAQT